jgi:FAD:protein FMN transferase
VRLEEAARAMGTTYSLVLYGDDEQHLRTSATFAFGEIERIDQMLSNYIPASELSHINDRAAHEPVPVSPELFSLLSLCVESSRQSEGAFDITVGRLMEVWGFYGGSGAMPCEADLRSALESAGYQHLVLNARDQTVRFAVPGLNLDPGGVGKGYAIDRAVAVLREAGIESGLISAGGSVIYGIGTPPEDPAGWTVQILDPERCCETVSEVRLKDASLSTSGSYEKFFWYRGKRYGHILDPRTGYPCEGMLSVSVRAPSALDSEIWTKPYFILGSAWAREHKPAEVQVFVCEDDLVRSSSWLC